MNIDTHVHYHVQLAGYHVTALVVGRWVSEQGYPVLLVETGPDHIENWPERYTEPIP